MTSNDPPPRPERADHQRFWEVDPSSPRALVWPAGLFAVITFFVGADLAADLAHDMSWSHVGVELVAMCFCLAGVLGSGLVLRRALARARELHHHLEGTRRDLHAARTEADALRAGLGTALDDQFERWGLTIAQREVALLVLKGLSYKEVAELRSTAEHTVRNQALAIFRKAGLAGRAEMAAFFIEDLLMPRDPVSLRARGDEGKGGSDGAAA